MKHSLPYQIRRFSLLLLGILIFVFLTPVADRTLGDTVILPLVGLYLATQWKAFRRISRQDILTLVLSAFYIVMILLYRLWGLSDASMSAYFTTLKFHLCFAFMVPLARTLRRKESKFLLAVAIASMLLTMVYNIHLQSVYGAKFTMRAFRLEGLKGIISTQYTTSVLLVSGAFLAAALQGRGWKFRLLAAALLAACVHFNLKVGQRGIVFFLSFILYGLVIVFNKPLDKRRILGLMALAVLGVLAFMRADSILGWMSANISSERLQVRITAVQDMLSHKSVKMYGGSFSARWTLIGRSWDTFRETPQNLLFGVGDRRANNMMVGNHSQLVDEFARYGLLGGALSIWLLLRQLRFVRRVAGPEPGSPLARQLGCIFFVLWVRCLMGAVMEMSNGVQLFITIPLFLRMAQEGKNQDRRLWA